MSTGSSPNEPSNTSDDAYVVALARLPQVGPARLRALLQLGIAISFGHLVPILRR